MATPTAAGGVEPPSLDAMLNNLVYILEAHKSHVRSSRDWALLFAHSFLLASDFSFAGLQQQAAAADVANSDRSPILPAECWSDSGRANAEDIVLLYRRRSQQQQQQQLPYVLCIVTMGADLIVSLAQRDTALSCQLPGAIIQAVDASREGVGAECIQRAYPEVERLHRLLWDQLFRRLPFNQRQQQQQQQPQPPQQQQPQRPIPMPMGPPGALGPRPLPPLQPPVASPFDYGRADLDPFGGGGGGGGGGMRFDPLRAGPPRRGPQPPFLDPYGRPLPPGAVPPGARFDPYGPPGGHPPDLPDGGGGGGFGAGPDPDHMRPPGWEGGGFGGGRGGGGFGGNFYM